MENRNGFEREQEVRIGNLVVHRNWEDRLDIMAVTPLPLKWERVLNRLFCRVPHRDKQIWTFRGWMWLGRQPDELETEEMMTAIQTVLKAIGGVV